MLDEVLPELADAAATTAVELLDTLAALKSARFEPAMSVLLRSLHSPDAANSRERLIRVSNVCRRLKFSNDETDCICWLIDSLVVIKGIGDKPPHIRRPLLAHPYAAMLLDLSAALANAAGIPPDDAESCRVYLAGNPAESLLPAPLVDGRDAMHHGVPAGPAIRDLLTTIRNEQLDGLLTTREAALVRLNELVSRTR